MPNYKRKRPSTAFRRRPKARKTSTAPGRLTRLNPSRGISGFPTTIRTTLKYCDVITLTSTAGAVSQYAFRLNSAYDPDYTGGGHQPYFYDQFAAIYRKYTVMGSTFKASFCPIVSATTTVQPSGPLLIGISSDDDGVLPGSNKTIQEVTGSQSALLGNAMGGNNVKTFSLTYDPKRDLNLDPKCDVLTVPIGANPGYQWFASIFATEQGLGSPSSVVVNVEILFDVVFSQMTDNAGS